MNTGILIRESSNKDIAQLKSLYSSAFPDEDLYPLVEGMLPENIKTLSLVGEMNKKTVSHILFTMGSVSGSSGEVALMGPIAVSQEHQREGLGTALIKDGLSRLRMVGVIKVCVLGAPAYYSRFGFKQEQNVATPYPLPDQWREAWQSIPLGEDGESPEGTLSLPKPWCDPIYWS